MKNLYIVVGSRTKSDKRGNREKIQLFRFWSSGWILKAASLSGADACSHTQWTLSRPKRHTFLKIPEGSVQDVSHLYSGDAFPRCTCHMARRAETFPVFFEDTWGPPANVPRSGSSLRPGHPTIPDCIGRTFKWCLACLTRGPEKTRAHFKMQASFQAKQERKDIILDYCWAFRHPFDHITVDWY